MKIIINFEDLVDKKCLAKINKIYSDFKGKNDSKTESELFKIFYKRYFNKILNFVILDISKIDILKNISNNNEININVEYLKLLKRRIHYKLNKILKRYGLENVEISNGISILERCQSKFIDIAISDDIEAINVLSKAIYVLTNNDKASINKNTYIYYEFGDIERIVNEINNKKLDKKIGKASIDKPWLKYYPKAGVTKKFDKKSIYDLLYDSNKSRKNAPALNYFGRKIKYNILFQNIERTANAYAKLGVKKGDIITMCVVNTPEVVYSLYALNKLGAVVNMIDPRTTPEGIKNYINEVKSDYVVTITPLYDLINSGVELLTGNEKIKQIIVISPTDSLPYLLRKAADIKERIDKSSKKINIMKRDITWIEFIKNGKNVISQKVDFVEDSAAIIVHTGGTTGTPKGVVITNEAMNNMALQHRIADLGFEPGQVYLNILVPFVGYGLLMATHLPLCLSMEVVLIPSFDPEKFDELFIKYHPNNVLGIPSYFDALRHSDKKDKLDFSTLNFAAVGGDAISPEVLTALDDFMRKHGFTHHLHTGYGMTEACSGTCCTRDRCYVKNSSGIPLPRTVVSVFDPKTNEELGYNEQGEICITGETIAKEYYKNPDETSKTFVKHKDGTIWVHSGDLGRVDENGIVRIDGRIKRMIISSGFKVFPPEIEQLLYTHPAVEKCIVIPVPHPEHTNVPVAVVILKEKYRDIKEIITNDLIEICKKQLPDYKIPFQFFYRNTYPLTNIGKVDFQKLIDEYGTKTSFEKNNEDNKVLKNAVHI